MFKFKKKSEQGRSMVEMLGVLAIIGVLSIGGIAGYTLSMRRYRANQIIDMANKYALIVYGACQQAVINGEIEELNLCRSNNTPSLENANIGHLADAQIGYTSIGQNSISNQDFIVLSINFNDENICKTVKGMVKHNQKPSCTGTSSHSFFSLNVFFNQN